MQIPKKLPQFSKYPALFISSGEYEACFYLALNGKLMFEKSIKMAPREEAKEKQGFVGKKGGRYGLAAVSHHGAYVEDLKKKFKASVHAMVHEIIAKQNIKEIFIFAPTYVSRRIINGLEKSEQQKVRMKFNCEITKLNPLEMVKIFWKEAELAITSKIELGEDEKKILKKPRLK
jgi:hypothetical protein